MSCFDYAGGVKRGGEEEGKNGRELSGFERGNHPLLVEQRSLRTETEGGLAIYLGWSFFRADICFVLGGFLMWPVLSGEVFPANDVE